MTPNLNHLALAAGFSQATYDANQQAFANFWNEAMDMASTVANHTICDQNMSTGQYVLGIPAGTAIQGMKA
jgi:hypothetical protein